MRIKKFRWLAPILCVQFIAACSGPGSGKSIAPGLTGPSPKPVATWTVSGQVWIYDDGGRRAASGGWVFGWIQPSAAEISGYATARITMNANGRYQFQIPQGTGGIRVTSVQPSTG